MEEILSVLNTIPSPYSDLVAVAVRRVVVQESRHVDRPFVVQNPDFVIPSFKWERYGLKQVHHSLPVRY